MNEETPGPGARGAPAEAGPIDFAHLDRQTFGDAAVQRQVLALFAMEARRLVAGIGAAESDEERRAFAHALAGAARGVGAFSVGDIAAAVERGETAGWASLDALARAVEAACAAIDGREGRTGPP